MSLLSFLKELFGISGHNSANAHIIATVAEETSRENKKLCEQLNEYKKKKDPFGALMIDLYNKRALSQIMKP